MNTSDFDYNLPTELIAQKPMELRDHSRLMVVDKKNKSTEHRKFFDIVEYFRAGDLLVWNNSKVFKARLSGQLLSGSGEVLRDHTKPVEIFLVRPMENTGVWKVLAKPGRHVQPGTRVQFTDDFYCDVMVKEKNGTVLVQFPDSEDSVREKANKHGSVPLPPYVKDEKHEIELTTYQTAYAKEEGSVAAPTAGFHFTPEVIEKLKQKGVEFAEVTLHVGLGTFLPVKSERIEDHVMHSEWVEVSEGVAAQVNKAKEEGRRVIAVGTTSTRTLEGVAKQSLPLSGGVVGGRAESPKDGLKERPPLTLPDRGGSVTLRSYVGDIDIFIKPGFTFQIVDAMITNFHLPKSTLLMLTSAFAGDREFMLQCYKEAVEREYRFFSFGDGMFIQ